MRRKSTKRGPPRRLGELETFFAHWLALTPAERLKRSWALRANPKGVRFDDLSLVCEHFFGQPRRSGSSHRVYPTPWAGDPRVNIQAAKNMAKAYQVRQVLQAIARRGS